MTGRRYNPQEDAQIIEFLPAVGLRRLSLDMARSEESIQRRADHLEASGAWEAKKLADLAVLRARHLAGHVTPTEWENRVEQFAQIEMVNWAEAEEAMNRAASGATSADRDRARELRREANRLEVLCRTAQPEGALINRRAEAKRLRAEADGLDP